MKDKSWLMWSGNEGDMNGEGGDDMLRVLVGSR
jgi:hypothetical protein